MNNYILLVFMGCLVYSAAEERVSALKYNAECLKKSGAGLFEVSRAVFQPVMPDSPQLRKYIVCMGQAIKYLDANGNLIGERIIKEFGKIRPNPADAEKLYNDCAAQSKGVPPDVSYMFLVCLKKTSPKDVNTLYLANI